VDALASAVLELHRDGAQPEAAHALLLRLFTAAEPQVAAAANPPLSLQELARHFEKQNQARAAKAQQRRAAPPQPLPGGAPQPGPAAAPPPAAGRRSARRSIAGADGGGDAMETEAAQDGEGNDDAAGAS
jgi:hypothetical protein